MSRQFDLVRSSQVDGALSNRNMIINGAMQVAQRGTSFVDPNGYTLDRFPVFGTVDVSRISGFSNFQYAMRITGKTGNTVAIGQQRIEGLNAAHLTGQSVTFSFYAKASTPITVGWSAATANSYDNFGATTNFGAGTFSVTTTETRYTVTIDNVPSSCANGILITFSPNNYGAFTSGTFDITGIQLEAGDTATPFEHEPFSATLLKCRRYYQNVYQRGNSTAGTYYSFYNRFYGNQVQFEPMRTEPTTSYSRTGGAFYWVNPGVNAYSANSEAGFSYAAYQPNAFSMGSIEFSQTRPSGGLTPSDFASYRLEAHIIFHLDAEL